MPKANETASLFSTAFDYPRGCFCPRKEVKSHSSSPLNPNFLPLHPPHPSHTLDPRAPAALLSALLKGLHRLHRVVEKRQETPLREDRVQIEAQGSLEVRLTWGWEILAQGEQGKGFSSHLQSPHAHGSLQCQGHSCHICMAAD